MNIKYLTKKPDLEVTIAKAVQFNNRDTAWVHVHNIATWWQCFARRFWVAMSDDDTRTLLD